MWGPFLKMFLSGKFLKFMIFLKLGGCWIYQKVCVKLRFYEFKNQMISKFLIVWGESFSPKLKFTFLFTLFHSLSSTHTEKNQWESFNGIINDLL